MPNPPTDLVNGKSKPPLAPGAVTEVVTVPASSTDSSVLSWNLLRFEIWLGGLDSIEEQIRNPTKDGKN
jgi:hypothetical protein